MAIKPTYEELEQRVALYNMEREEERNRTLEALEERTRVLDERVKELNCFYDISELVEKPGIELEEIIQGVVDLIPPSWQYQEITCSRIILGSEEYNTANYRGTDWKQSKEILVNGEQVGAVEVYYLEEKPELVEGPFLKEERRLIDAIAERLGRIIERKWLDADRERLNIELIAKNQELEQIVYITSHDLRSPLVNIQGFSKELVIAFKEVTSIIENEEVTSGINEKLAPALKRDIPEAVKFINTSVNKMDSLLTGLLTLSRLGRAALDFKSLDMNKIMFHIAVLFDYKIKQACVSVRIDKLPSCYGDETQINQVFSNIVDNALKFLNPKHKGVIKISGYKENHRGIYCVEDNGIGIRAEHQKMIFEIFHQLDPKENKGEGLGLAITQKILDRHGGRIWLESEPGKGSKFFVSIPLKK